MPRDKVVVGFTTRAGGISKPPFDSLNFGRMTADDPIAVEENFRRFHHYMGVAGSQMATMKQVHGDRVRIVGHGGDYLDTDGLVTAEPGVVLVVKTADCLPLILFDPVHSVSAAVHCGWRSLTSGIAEKAVSLMASTFGSAPEDIAAAIGPSAGPCCYEIGDDVARFLSEESVIRRDGTMFGDLRRELVLRLRNAGLDDLHIESGAPCTICDPSRFFSHRRDGLDSGRMIGFIMIRDIEGNSAVVHAAKR